MKKPLQSADKQMPLKCDSKPEKGAMKNPQDNPFTWSRTLPPPPKEIQQAIALLWSLMEEATNKDSSDDDRAQATYRLWGIACNAADLLALAVSQSSEAATAVARSMDRWPVILRPSPTAANAALAHLKNIGVATGSVNLKTPTAPNLLAHQMLEWLFDQGYTPCPASPDAEPLEWKEVFEIAWKKFVLKLTGGKPERCELWFHLENQQMQLKQSGMHRANKYKQAPGQTKNPQRTIDANVRQGIKEATSQAFEKTLTKKHPKLYGPVKTS